jgi:hypothetical protein
MSTRLLGRPTGVSPIVSARHSSFPRAWSPNEARWEPRRGVIPELLLDRTALRSRQQPAHRLDETLIARGRRPPQGGRCHSAREWPPRGSSEPARVSGMLCQTHSRRQPATDRPEQR